jgi:membrane protein implicated in regulation of membrane protease activity
MQTRTRSLIEQLFNTASGFILAMLTWAYIITPFLEIQSNTKQNFTVVMVFTVISIVRSYAWRRFFNWLDHKNNKKHSHDIDRNHGPRP